MTLGSGGTGINGLPLFPTPAGPTVPPPSLTGINGEPLFPSAPAPPASQAPPAGAGAGAGAGTTGQRSAQGFRTNPGMGINPSNGSDYISYVENPPFDPRIRQIPGVALNDPYSVGGNTLFRGRIETRDKVNGYYRRLNFLYNPSGIQWQGNVDTNTIGDSSVMDPNDASSWLMPMSQTVAFSLLFDRTYETWVYDANIETSRLGVVADIKHFYAMLGILGDPTAYLPQNVSRAAGGAKPGTADTWGTAMAASLKNTVDVSLIDDASPTSFMQYVQVRAIMGNNVSYYGVINSSTISYTHFTQRMIPNRCSVDISMTLFPVTNAVVNLGHNDWVLSGTVAPGQPGNMGVAGR
jgi:hypothetical protein